MDDIAKRLGVSKGTVSKAFSGAEDVSESMRRAVLETAVELGYTRQLCSWQPPQRCSTVLSAIGVPRRAHDALNALYGKAKFPCQLCRPDPCPETGNNFVVAPGKELPCLGIAAPVLLG